MQLKKIGKYEIFEKIGIGGFGTIYRGRDPYIKRDIAIKTCNSDEDEIKRRFFKEAEFAGNLQHPNICTIYDFGVEEGIPYIVLEYLSGEDLDKKIKRKEILPTEIKLGYMIALCEALAYAHSRGIVHRDIKPSNLRILADGSTKIMDFGIAKSMHVESNLTQTGMTLGTAAYLAPEQIKGEPVDARTDIFSAGVLMYELFTYVKPFQGEHISTILYKILNEEPDSVTKFLPDFPADLDAVIMMAMDKTPARRYQTIDEFSADLQAVRRNLSGTSWMPLTPTTPSGGVSEVTALRAPPAPQRTQMTALRQGTGTPADAMPLPRAEVTAATRAHSNHADSRATALLDSDRIATAARMPPPAPGDPVTRTAHIPSRPAASSPSQRVEFDIEHVPRSRTSARRLPPPAARKSGHAWAILGGIVVFLAFAGILATQFLGIGEKKPPPQVASPSPAPAPVPVPAPPTPEAVIEEDLAALADEGRAFIAKNQLLGKEGAYATLQRMRAVAPRDDPNTIELAETLGDAILASARASERRREYDKAINSYAKYAALDLGIEKQDVAGTIANLRKLQETAAQPLRVTVVSAIPGTSLTIDGVLQPGELPPPKVVELRPGAHRFTFSAPGQEDQTVSRTLRAAETIVNPARQGGRLTVVQDLGSPYGAVAVDGKSYGNTPQKDIRVSAGTHEVTVTREGYEPFSIQIKVESGASTTVKATLRKIS